MVVIIKYLIADLFWSRDLMLLCVSREAGTLVTLKYISFKFRLVYSYLLKPIKYTIVSNIRGYINKWKILCNYLGLVELL